MSCVTINQFHIGLGWGNIENVTYNFQFQHWLLHIYETTQFRLYKLLREDLPIVNTKASGVHHLKDHHHDPSEIIQVVGTFHHHKLI